MSLSSLTGWPMHVLATAVGLKAFGESDEYIARHIGATPQQVQTVIGLTRQFINDNTIAEAVAVHEAVEAEIAERILNERVREPKKKRPFAPRNFKVVEDADIVLETGGDVTGKLLGDPAIPAVRQRRDYSVADIRHYDERLALARSTEGGSKL